MKYITVILDISIKKNYNVTSTKILNLEEELLVIYLV